MADKKQNNELDLKQTKDVAGGTIGETIADYSIDDYKDVGITCVRHKLKSNEYFWKGHSISRKDANTLVELNKEHL